jgi:hypothetical protein
VTRSCTIFFNKIEVKTVSGKVCVRFNARKRKHKPLYTTTSSLLFLSPLDVGKHCFATAKSCFLRRADFACRL